MLNCKIPYKTTNPLQSNNKSLHTHKCSFFQFKYYILEDAETYNATTCSLIHPHYEKIP